MRQKALCITNEVDPTSIKLAEESMGMWICYYNRMFGPKDVIGAHNYLLVLY